MRIKNYLLNHLYALVYSLGQVSRAPLSSVMTVVVIGITLAFPAGLYVVLKNAQRLAAGWDDAAQISLFLKKDVDDQAAARLAKRLHDRSDIASIKTVLPDQALKEFQRQSGFADALRALEGNPLPAVLLIQPAAGFADPVAVERLQSSLRKLPEADFVQLDIQWVQRLHAVLGVAQRGVEILAVLLGLAVLLIVGNTIRLGIQNNRDEIAITKLIGATNAFVRRPFLYAGTWYGLLGGLIAWGLVALALWLLDAPVRQLSALYDSGFELGALDIWTALLLLAAGTLLGLLGSWLAVGRHLSEAEPR
ncbi:MAG: cell division protein FtsX [Gammaproteobacteria bacterium]|nr:cell division protein FtsX [Gammaproteobacteria bacterium]